METKEKIQKIKFLTHENIDVVILEEQEDNILFFVDLGFSDLDMLKIENNLRIEKADDFVINDFKLKGYVYKSKSLGDIYLYEISFLGESYDLYVAIGSLKKLMYNDLSHALRLFLKSEEFSLFTMANSSGGF